MQLLNDRPAVFLFVLILVTAATGPLCGQPPTAHPLDPLSTSEIAAAA